MNKKFIKQLTPEVIKLIAAGEVVERPASIIKELIENSIDANSTKIKVEVFNYGKDKIIVSDDGDGITEEDIGDSIKLHATSKIQSAQDLYNIKSLGFRGEALAAISSCSKEFIIESKHINSNGVILIKSNDTVNINTINKIEKGTKVTVSGILDNIPARKNFLKSDSTELKHIIDTFLYVSFPYTNIQFELYHQGKLIHKLTKTENILDRIFEIWGKNVSTNFIDTNEYLLNQDTKIRLIIGKPIACQKTSFIQLVYINNRFVYDKTLYSTIYQAYKGFIHKELKPFYIAFIYLNPNNLDVNIHPRKLEVKISSGDTIYRTIYTITQNTLLNSTKYEFNNSESNKNTYVLKEEELNNTYNNQNTQKNLRNNITEQFKKTINNKKNNAENFNTNIKTTKKIQEALFFTKSFLEDNKINNYFLDNIEPFQIFMTYIVYENNEDLIIIDQHAASEKIIFEKLATIKDTKADAQKLLIPEIFSLQQYEKEKLLSLKSDLEKINFKIEDYQGNDIAITEIPNFLFQKPSIKEIIQDILNHEFEEEKLFLEYASIYPNINKISYQIIATLSCHSSIRAGQNSLKLK